MSLKTAAEAPTAEVASKAALCVDAEAAPALPRSPLTAVENAQAPSTADQKALAHARATTNKGNALAVAMKMERDAAAAAGVAATA